MSFLSLISVLGAGGVVSEPEPDPVTTYQWTLVGESPTPQWWDGIGALSHGGRLYQVAGWNPNYNPVTFNDIFYSEDDGGTWTLQGNAPFSRRHCMGCFTASDGYCYVIGSDQYAPLGTDKTQVWRTNTPEVIESWTLVTGTAGFGQRVFFGVCELAGYVYVVGGQVGTQYSVTGGFDDVWRAPLSDMATWTKVSEGHAFLSKCLSGCVAAHAGKIYVVSGGKYDEAVSGSVHGWDAEVYSSPDGITWTQEEDVLEASQYPSVISWDGKLWYGLGRKSPNVNSYHWSYMDEEGHWHLATMELTNPTNGVYNNTYIRETHATALVIHNDTIMRLNGSGSRATFRFEREST